MSNLLEHLNIQNIFCTKIVFENFDFKDTSFSNIVPNFCRLWVWRWQDLVKNAYFHYSYNSIKRTCSIKQPGLDFFKKSLLKVPYYHNTACRKQLNVLLY